MKNYIQNPNQKVVITFDNNQTLARIYENNKVVAKGIATCSPEDQFDIKAGSQLALTRALESIKHKIEWVAVNRDVRVGDYIRLTRKWFDFNEVGDILRVYEVLDNKVVGVRSTDHPRRTGTVTTLTMWHYMRGYYEVVERASESYKFRKITRQPKKGDYMRVIEGPYSFDNSKDYLKIHKVDTYLDNVRCVTIHSNDHTGALAAGLRCDSIHWNYAMSLNKLEFYEKVD